MSEVIEAAGVVRKAFEILSYFRLKPEGMSLAELSELTTINRSTAHRLLSQLEAVGFLERIGRGRYRVGQVLFQLGLLAPQPLELRAAADPAMSLLAHETGETVSLAVLEHAQILVLSVIESAHDFLVLTRVGRRAPFHMNALGKAIAAFLSNENLEALSRNMPMPLERRTPNSIGDLATLRSELCVARERGYAINNEEDIIGVRAVAAPIFNGQGEVKAALSIPAPASRIPDERIPSLSSSIIRAADSVTIRLGGDPSVSRLLARKGHTENAMVEQLS